jgi:hypothetical protein
LKNNHSPEKEENRRAWNKALREMHKNWESLSFEDKVRKLEGKKLYKDMTAPERKAYRQGMLEEAND